MNPMGHVMSHDPSLSAYLTYFKALAFLTGIVAVISWLCVIISVATEVKSVANRGRRSQRANTYWKGVIVSQMLSSIARLFHLRATRPERAEATQNDDQTAGAL